MPLKRLCPKCQRVIDYNLKYCLRCQKIIDEIKKKRQKEYDRHIRYSKANKMYARFYKTKEWIVTRATVLNYYNSIDLFSYYIENKIEHADTVHHIEEIKDNWDKRLEFINLFPLTANNHNKIHKLYLRDKAGTQELLKKLLEKFKKDFKK
ncbi:hypothetical protein [Wukongibacter sp. M2B1]|uniref:hypothetical protein n=1 Tax=Wukongibacter sp. M2B1 TaxID=3088895 RepID=UPI003D793C6C